MIAGISHADLRNDVMYSDALDKELLRNPATTAILLRLEALDGRIF
ncbi:MAG: hypothetical protein RL522_983 [Pseudomonadota bacterium]|jgi:hypothetical protein